MVRLALLSASMLFPVLLQQAAGHSWVACADYTGNTQTYQPGQCRGYARNFFRYAGELGADTGFNYQITNGAVCPHPLNNPVSAGYTAAYPAATYSVGQTVTLAWPSKNHVAAQCTNQYIPDTEMSIRLSPLNPTADPAIGGFTKIATLGPHINGQIDFKGFQNCPLFCQNMDKSLCTGTFVVPNVPAGRYTLLWYWVFNENTPAYTSCMDVTITAGASTTTTTTTSSSTTSSSTTTTTSTSTSTSSSSSTSTGEFAGNATGYPDVIALSSYPSVLPTSGSFQVTVQYSANVERDIVVDILRLPDYAWFGKGITFVPAGASSLQLTITISGSIPVGTNYELKGWIAPRGQGSAPNGWYYELDRVEMPVSVGTRATSTSASTASTSPSGSPLNSAAVVAPGLLLLVLVAICVLLL
eukprot:TRINITY_DN5172_c0_g1_i4.p1 TRINITY_DN5172_c0_g1~~TRINITY_DN5172_c0_g1_i4.p1  ORF type:complete len:432 (-),score=68.50 TRINITY_DN5172_c0_g1_i4:140-1381(-)